MSTTEVESPVKTPEWLEILENKRKRPHKLAHEIGAGAPCLVCKEACKGLNLHFWRKLCIECKCRKEDHEVQEEEDYAQFEILFGAKKVKRTTLKFNAQNKSFDWIPPNVTPELAVDYLKSIPQSKLPISNTEGARYRKQQLEKQLPLHDVDPNACHNLSDKEMQEFQKYLDNLKNNVIGQGKIMKYKSPKMLKENYIRGSSPNMTALSEEYGNVKPQSAEIRGHLSVDKVPGYNISSHPLITKSYPVEGHLNHNSLNYSQPINSTQIGVQPLRSRPLEKNQNVIFNNRNDPLKPSDIKYGGPKPFSPIGNFQKEKEMTKGGTDDSLINGPTNLGLRTPSSFIRKSPIHDRQNNNAAVVYQDDNCNEKFEGFPAESTLQALQQPSDLAYLEDLKGNHNFAMAKGGSGIYGKFERSNQPSDLVCSENIKGNHNFAKSAAGIYGRLDKYNQPTDLISSEDLEGNKNFVKGGSGIYGKFEKFQQPSNMISSEDLEGNRNFAKGESGIYGKIDKYNQPSNQVFSEDLEGNHNYAACGSGVYGKLDKFHQPSNLTSLEDLEGNQNFVKGGSGIYGNIDKVYQPSNLISSQDIEKNRNFPKFGNKIYGNIDKTHQPSNSVSSEDLEGNHSFQTPGSGIYGKVQGLPGCDTAQKSYPPSNTENFEGEQNFVHAGSESAFQPTPISASICKNPLDKFNELNISSSEVPFIPVQETGNISIPKKNTHLIPGNITSNQLGDQPEDTSISFPAPPSTCQQCLEILYPEEVVVQTERGGNFALWHAKCFVCETCKELLVDLMYFFHKGKVYCGRHYAEIMKIMRCHACDELIFVKEYTVAEGQSYHVRHFCCFHCDQPLGGKQYVPKDNNPVCLDCYQAKYGKNCQTCSLPIAANEQRVSWKHLDFHVYPQCFRCAKCLKSLLGGKFMVKNDNTFCSKDCFQEYVN